MMKKIVLPGSYDFGVPSTQTVKIASAGLRGNDLRDFIKRAGAQMADAMRKLAFSSGEIPLHVIALGSTEYYGPNRNGDGFTEDCCRKYHDTFVKHAKWFHNHANTKNSKSYGIIKYSCYNEPMHRVELIVALNGTKAAAARNKGFVAEEEMEKIARGEDIPTSMSCKIAYDVCSICGNRAKTRDDYCTGLNEGGDCEGGGCKNNLCKVAEDGRITFVDNPHPLWFDMSKVYRGADRISFALGKLEKAAAARVKGGAELADDFGITMPIELALANVTSRQVREQVKLASELSDREKELTSGLVKSASVINTVTYIPGLDALPTDRTSRADILKALSREKIAMSLSDFIQFVSSHSRPKAEVIAKEVQPYTSNIFYKLASDTDKLIDDLTNNPFRHSDKEPTRDRAIWASFLATEGSLDPTAVQKRAWTKAIREEIPYTPVKPVSHNKACEGLARAYGLYKLAFLNEIRKSDKHFALTVDLVLRQNQVS